MDKKTIEVDACLETVLILERTRGFMAGALATIVVGADYSDDDVRKRLDQAFEILTKGDGNIPQLDDMNVFNNLREYGLITVDQSKGTYSLTSSGNILRYNLEELEIGLLELALDDRSNVVEGLDQEIKEIKKKRESRSLATTALIFAAYALSSTPAHADIGDAIRAPVGGQVQVIAGQRIAQQTSSSVSVTGKLKDEIMYGGIIFTYNSALPTPSLTLEAGPHFHPDKWHLLPLADVTFPLNGVTPTLGAALYAMANPNDKFSLDVGGKYSYNTAANTHSLEGRVTPATALGKGWFVGEETVVLYDVNGPVKVTTGPALRYAKDASHFTLVPAYQLTATADGVQHAFVYSVRGRVGVQKKAAIK